MARWAKVRPLIRSGIYRPVERCHLTICLRALRSILENLFEHPPELEASCNRTEPANTTTSLHFNLPRTPPSILPSRIGRKQNADDRHKTP